MGILDDLVDNAPPAGEPSALDRAVTQAPVARQTIGDYARKLQRGATSTFQTAPAQLATMAGAPRTAVEQSQKAEQAITERLSPAGRFVDSAPLVSEEGGLGPAPVQTVLSAAVESAPSLVQAFVAGKPIFDVLGRARVAERVAGAAQRAGVGARTAGVVGRAAEAVPFAAVEGVQAGAMAAADMGKRVRDLSDEKLRASPAFAEAYAATDPAASPESRLAAAREAIAQRAERQALAMTGASTGTIGMATGAGVIGQFARRLAGRQGAEAAADTLLKATIKGAGAEAAQETPQSGAEQLIANWIEQGLIDPNQPLTEDVLNAALTGGAAGGLLGGLGGGAGRLAQRTPEPEREPTLDEIIDSAPPAGETANPIPGTTVAIDETLTPPVDPAAGPLSAGVAAGQESGAIATNAIGGPLDPAPEPGPDEAVLAQRQAQQQEQARAQQAQREEKAADDESERLSKAAERITGALNRALTGLEQERESGNPEAIEHQQALVDLQRDRLASINERLNRLSRKAAGTETLDDADLGQRPGAARPGTDMAAAVLGGQSDDARRSDAPALPAPAGSGGAGVPAPEPSSGARDGTGDRTHQPDDAGRAGAVAPTEADPVARLRELETQWSDLRARITDAPADVQADLQPEIDAVLAERETLLAQRGALAQAAPAEAIDTAAALSPSSPSNGRPEATGAQKDAGNYLKPAAKVAGLTVRIENEAGTQRRPEWPPLAGHYGYVARTEAADSTPTRKQGVDVFVKPGTPEDFAGPVFVVDQFKQNGRFDEHKAMIGYADQDEAEQAYRASYSPEWTGMGAITPMSLDQFKTWLTTKSKKPVAPKLRVVDPAQAARRKRAYADANPFRAFLAEYGVSVADRSDVGGERNRPVMVPYHGPLFRRNGLRLDELAWRAVEAGFLTQADIDSDLDNGGVNKLSDMIRRELAGERILPVTAAESEQEAQWRAEMDARYEAMQEAEDAIVEQASDDEINALLQLASDEDAEASNEEIDYIAGQERLGGETQESAAGDAPRGDSRGGAEARAESPGEVERPSFDLDRQSADDVRRQEEQRRKDEARAEREAAEQARRDAAPPAEDFTLAGSDRPADQAAARGQQELAPTEPAEKQEPSEPEGADEAMRKHGFEAVGWNRGKGLNKNKWSAAAYGISSNYYDTAEEAVAELREWTDRRARGRENEARQREIAQTAADKIRRGEQPTDAEWAAIFPGWKEGHRYVRQPEASWFLTEFLGVPKHSIRANIGAAAGTFTSDTGAKYPIVYPKRLAEVFGSATETRDGQPVGRDGLTDTERASNRLDGIADELAMQVQQESSERDFAPSEIPAVIEQWAKDNKVDAGELRTRVVDRLRKRLSEGRMRQVEHALSEKKPAGPITNLEEARRVVKDGRQGKLKQSLLKSAIERAEAGDVGDLASRLAASKAEIEKQAKKSAVEEDASEAEIERLAQAIARADTARVIERKLRELNESRGTGTSSDLAWGTGGGGNYIRDLRVLERALEIANRTPPGGKIEDFGEKLEGARKDQAPSLSKELTDEAIAAEPFSKIWPADEAAGIEDTFAAAVATAARAEVTAKPRVAYKLKRWVEKVKGVRSLATRITSGQLTREEFLARLAERSALEGFAAKVRLLEMIDRAHWKRIGAVREYPDAYTYDSSGKKVASPDVYVEIDGKTAVIDGAGRVTDDAVLDRVNTLLGLERAEKKMAFEVRGRGSSFFINKKGDPEYRKLKQFTTSKEAFDFVHSNHAELVGLWEAVKDSDNVKKADVRRAENRQRTGADRRGGLDVTPEQFEQAFGFRGVQFGDWVGQGADAKARQGMLNQAYDALHDLAEIIGVPTRAISLNGTMGLAFGARGRGWASAHFEPDNLVINLTKTRGAGSLAHEWFHALDNYFSRMRRDGEESPFTGDQHGYRRQNYITYQPEAYYEKAGRTIRARDFEAAIAAGPLQAGASREDRRNYNLRRQIGSTDGWVKRDAVRPQVEERFAALVEALKASPMAKRASTIDKGSSDGYWSRIIELGARAFETFVIARMAQKGYHNDFLANVVASDDFVRSAERYPYPKPDELAPIEQAFDDLFGTIETRETDRGLAIFEPTAQYRVDEPQDTQADLFGVPEQPGENRRTRPNRAGVRRNVQPAATLSDTEAPAGEYFLRTVLGTQTNRQLGASVIKTHADAARATKYLYRNAVERFDGIVTDKNGKPLAVVGGFKGALSQASVYPATLIGEAVRIPGAARIWFSHNHPSGTAELSSSDARLHRALNSVFRGSGIEPMGLLAVAGDSYAFQGVSASGWTGVDVQNNLPIEDKAGQVEVPVVERMIAPGGATAMPINAPAAALDAGRLFYGRTKEPGLMLLNAQNHVVAWVPLSSNLLGRLRGTGGLQSLYRAISESTVGASIIVHGGELDAAPAIDGVPVIENIGAALAQVDVTPLDAINAATGESRAEKGLQLASGPVFSRGTGAGLPAPEVTRIADAVRKAWANGPEVVVVEGMDDPQIPAAVRAEDARQRSGGASGAPEGFFADGRVYLVASELASEADVVRVLAHESLGHYGLRGLYGNALNGVLDKVIEVRRADVIAKMRAYGLPNTLDGRRTAAEEVLAGLAQTQPKLNLVRAAIAAIRSWLRRVLPNLRVTDADIIAQFILPARAFVERGARGATDGVAFQRVWHGTPHVFDKFSTDAVGTGEGAQAYGWGLYFASLRDIAEHYRKALSSGYAPRVIKDGVELSSAAEIAEAFYKIGRVFRDYRGIDKVLDFDRQGKYGWSVKVQELDADGNPKYGSRPRWHSTFPNFKDLEHTLTADGYTIRKGSLYEVEIPEDDEFLLWDKTWSDQPASVRDALGSASSVLTLVQEFGDNRLDGRGIYKALSANATAAIHHGTRSFADVAAFGKTGDEAASKYLLSLGIAGIKYLDSSSRNVSTIVVDSSGNQANLQGERSAESFINGFDSLDEAIAEADRQARDYQNMQHIAGVLRGWKAKGYALKERKGTFNYVVFDDSRTKITAAFSRRADVTPLGFYSELARKVEAGPGRADAANWKSFLRSQKGIKPDEIEWSGIEEWLALQQGKVTKDAVIEYLAGNGVRVEEVMLGNDVVPPGDEPELTADQIEIIEDAEDAEFWTADAPTGNRLIGKKHYPTKEAAREFALRYFNGHIKERNRERAASAGITPKFADHRVPGQSENYRELLLTLPPPPKKTVFTLYEGGNYFGQYASREEAEAAKVSERRPLATAIEIAAPEDGSVFRTSHWDQPNVLAHVRIDERTDADGKRVLFVNEIQSDWAQKGRKEGFADGRREGVRYTAVRRGNWSPGDDSMGKWEVFADGVSAGFFKANSEDYAIAEALDKRERMNNRPPRGPFVEKTDAWVALALKRVIRYAVDNGFDRVALVNGKQAAKMFNLSEHVTRLYYDRDGRGYILSADGRRGEVFPRDMQYSDEELDGVVGKEIAQKIRNREGREDDENGGMILEGVDLEVGGEGMEKFYPRSDLGPVGTDKNGKPIYPIVQLVAQKVLKQIGGPALTTVQMPVPGGTGRTMEVDRGPSFGGRQTIRIADELPMAQPGFDITPKMREQARAGVPMFSRAGSMGQRATDVLRSVTVGDVVHRFGNRLTDLRGIGLQALGRRQLTEVYRGLLPQLDTYGDIVQQMDAEKNETAAEADDLARRWGRLTDERAVADVMHDATLAGWDPDTSNMPADLLTPEMRNLADRFNALTPQAKEVYREARDLYARHYAAVKAAVRARIERAIPNHARRAEMLERMEAEMFGSLQGVYFPLARFGEYVVVVKNEAGQAEAVSRAETLTEAEAVRAQLLRRFPASRGFTVGKILKSREFNAVRDGVGRGFLKELYGLLDQEGVGEQLQDSINQLYLSSLPDLSWAKHGLHRKGTPGFSQDARRAFAQNVFHGARYLAKLRHADRLADQLMAMQEHVDERQTDDSYDSIAGQQVVDEMVKRHESYMNPNTHWTATTATSLGFVFYLGLSPASAAVNLSQTPLVAYPLMGAKWGFKRAGALLLAASRETAAAGNDLSKTLKDDELAAFHRAAADGTIDVTQAHDLAGIAQGEDAKVVWRLRPVMRAASFLFHHAERFNRQATFLASYRLAKQASPGISKDEAYRQAKKMTYDAHFDYSSSSRPRIMQGNVARVVLLFKQFAQNMIWTLARTGYMAAKGDKQALRAFSALVTSHALAAGVLGLPLVGVLLEAASWLGSSDDEPWDAEGALRNYMAEAIGKTPGAVVAHGLSRLTPWDISGRVGLDNLIFPDVREGLEGESWAHAAAASAAGPVLNMALIGPAKGLSLIADGHWMRGLEAMLPAVLRSGLKSVRYATEGAQTRDGKTIVEDVGMAEWLGQAAGFSPSRVRDAGKAREIVFGLDRRINARRASLIRDYGDAVMAKDHGAMGRQREAVLRFNAANPDRPITGATIVQSVRMRTMRAAEAEKGIYLPRKRRGLVEQGRFADVE